MPITDKRLRRPQARKPNQIIISGPQDQVDQLLVGAHKWISKQVGLLGSYSVGDVPHKIVLVYYAKSTVNDETEAFNSGLLEVARQFGLMSIRTEPNFTVAAPNGHKGNPYLWEGDPYLWEGDPYLWEGDPYLWEGDPYLWEGDPSVADGAVAQAAAPQSVGTTQTEAATLFASQGLLAQIKAARNGERNPDLNGYRGDGVLVGLFDSCPSQQELASLPGGSPSWLAIHPGPGTISSGPFVDHGLVNASLVHFVAPGAEVHLYQVLSGAMIGETAWLITALVSFLNLAEGRPTVVNMSMGTMHAGNLKMPALEGVLSELVRRGGVVCAAAGNGARSARKVAAVPQAQMPASLSYVIAVAASHQQMGRASYSQAGDIAAPGGETSGAGPDGTDDVIGLGTSSPTGYVRMDCGTSFSTPLVAAAAALAVADLVSKGAPMDDTLWQRTMERLSASALTPVGAVGSLETVGLGAGILQVVAPN